MSKQPVSRESVFPRRGKSVPMLSAEPPANRGTVLVVDDSPEVQRYLRAVLELNHYRVETADDGEAALQRVREGSTAAVVLLDMQMPGLNGLETLRHLRELRSDLKVIMCSGVDDPDQIHQALALGAQAYLIKPVQHLYLSAAVERCLPRSSDKRKISHSRSHLTLVPPSHDRPN